ncbi:hypothetical protein J6590_103929, partial [Homalodisca vitripennis]
TRFGHNFPAEERYSLRYLFPASLHSRTIYSLMFTRTLFKVILPALKDTELCENLIKQNKWKSRCSTRSMILVKGPRPPPTPSQDDSQICRFCVQERISCGHDILPPPSHSLSLLPPSRTLSFSLFLPHLSLPHNLF